MPRKAIFTKDEIISEALALTEEEGFEKLSARNLAARLGTSSKPIFGLFRNMEEVQEAVRKKAFEEYLGYLEREMTNGKTPPYKASGMGYIRFASERRNLFRLIFMRDRGESASPERGSEVDPIIGILMDKLSISKEKAEMFHLHMWVVVHGVASMIVTGYLGWTEESVSRLLDEEWHALINEYGNKDR